MEDLGWAGMRVVPTFEGFRSRLQAGTRSAGDSVAHSEGARFGTGFGARAGGAMRTKFAETAKYIVGPLIGAFAVEKIGEIIGESIRSASDLEAAQARANLIFGKGSHEVDDFGEHAAKSLGLSHLAALRAEAGFGLLGQRMQLNDEQNVKFSERFTGLAADLAAFNHTDPEAAFLALQRGVAGATRGLKPYGVLIDSTSIKAEALADGIVRPVKDSAAIHSAQVRVLADQQAYTAAIAAHGRQSIEAQKASAALDVAQSSLNRDTAGAVPALTQQQKMLAATKLIMAQTETQQGSFKRSSHELYGEQRQLSASWDDAKDRLGKGLLPVATDFVHGINRDLIPAVDRASHWFEKEGGPAIHDFQHQLAPLVKESLPALATGFHAAWGEAKLLLPVVTGIFGAFNDLPDFAQKAIVVGGGSALLARRFGLIGNRGGGGLGELASLSRPLPVAVVGPVEVIGLGGGLPGGGGGGVNPTVVGGGALAAEEAAAGTAGRAGLLARLFGRTPGAGASGLLGPAFLALGFAQANQKSETSRPPKIGPTLAGRPGPLGGFTADFNGDIEVTKTWAQFDKTLSHLVASGNLDEVDRQLRIQAESAATFEKIPLADAYRELDGVLPHVTGKLAKLTAGSGMADHGMRTLGMGVNSTLDGVTSHTEAWRTELGRLPKAVVTKISAPGADLSRQLALNLSRQYDLTPRQVDTLFRVLGIDEARQQITGLLGIYHLGGVSGGGVPSEPGMPKPKTRSGSGAGGGPVVHLHLEKLSIDQDGHVRSVVRSESEEDGRFSRQRIEAGSR